MSDEHLAFGVSKKTYEAILKRGIAQGKALGFTEGLKATQAHIQKQLDKELAKSSTSELQITKVIGRNVGEANPGAPNIERPIEHLKLAQRWYNRLKRAGVHWIKDIPAIGGPIDFTLMDVRDFGPRATSDLRAALAVLDLKLPDRSHT